MNGKKNHYTDTSISKLKKLHTRLSEDCWCEKPANINNNNHMKSSVKELNLSHWWLAPLWVDNDTGFDPRQKKNEYRKWIIEKLN